MQSKKNKNVLHKIKEEEEEEEERERNRDRIRERQRERESDRERVTEKETNWDQNPERQALENVFTWTISLQMGSVDTLLSWIRTKSISHLCPPGSTH